MQQPVAGTPGIPWHEPALWLAAIAALIRWVIGPAIVRYMREDLKPELQKLEHLPAMKVQLESLADVPDRLGRIETLLELAVRREGHNVLTARSGE